MPAEIERKFLVVSDAWRERASGYAEITQGYLAHGPPAVVRVRRMGQSGFLTMKSMAAGLVREEFEYEIPADDADTLLATLCLSPLIKKMRYDVSAMGRLWAVDVFAGRLRGLVLAEIELSEADQKIDYPAWIGREVTDQPEFRNDALSLRGLPAGSAPTSDVEA